MGDCIFNCGNGAQRHNNLMELKLAKNAFLSMSNEEQARVVRDIYGAEVPIEETPDFVQEKLQELDEELERLSDESQKYYRRAVQMEQEQLLQKQKSSNSDSKADNLYVGSEKFRLMFLRSERFDAALTARRLTFYFKEKYNLFFHISTNNSICKK